MITIPGVTLCGMSGLRINDIFLLPGVSCVEKKSGGRWQLSLLASVVISAFFLNTAYAWQQEYIVDTRPGHSPGVSSARLTS
ncbi:hypothetical protein ACUOCP_41430, partial [Escherichia sp. R-CC3]